MRAKDLMGYGPVGTNGPATMLKRCPFCGCAVRHSGHYFTCGDNDDGSDGCGAIVSFRPNLIGDLARMAWNKRSNT